MTRPKQYLATTDVGRTVISAALKPGDFVWHTGRYRRANEVRYQPQWGVKLAGVRAIQHYRGTWEVRHGEDRA